MDEEGNLSRRELLIGGLSTTLLGLAIKFWPEGSKEISDFVKAREILKGIGNSDLIYFIDHLEHHAYHAKAKEKDFKDGSKASAIYIIENLVENNFLSQENAKILFKVINHFDEKIQKRYYHNG